MKKVKNKLSDLERKQKEISDKLDKYEYNFNNEQKKVNNIDDFTFKNNNINNNFESCAKIDKDYQKVLDRRLDEIMGKINDNIINQNYIDFYNFLLKGRPKITKSKKDNKQKQNISQNVSQNNNNSSNNIVNNNKNQNIKKENENNINNDNININNLNNENTNINNNNNI